MRVREENHLISVHAIAGTHVVIFGLDVKCYEPKESCSDLSIKTSKLVLDGDKGGDNHEADSIIGFTIDRLDVEAKQRISLNVDGNPIQKLHYGDYCAEPGTQYEYTVCLLVRDDSSSKFVAHGQPVVVNVTTEDPSRGKHGELLIVPLYEYSVTPFNLHTLSL